MEGIDAKTPYLVDVNLLPAVLRSQVLEFLEGQKETNATEPHFPVYLSALPLELQEEILGLLEDWDVVACRRLSRHWASIGAKFMYVFVATLKVDKLLLFKAEDNLGLEVGLQFDRISMTWHASRPCRSTQTWRRA